MGGVRLEDAERAFKEWRREKDAGGPRLIPEPLWRKAVALARARGVSETAQRLRLNHGELKRRVDAAPAPVSPSFVEISPSQPPPPAGEAVVEVEVVEGPRLRLVLRGVSVAEATSAARELWSVVR